MVYKNDYGKWVVDDLPNHNYEDLGFDQYRRDWIKFRPYKGKDAEYYNGDDYTNYRNVREFNQQVRYNPEVETIYSKGVDKSKIRLPYEIEVGNYNYGDSFYGFKPHISNYLSKSDVLPCKLENSETTGFRVISYIDYLNKFLMVVENNEASSFGPDYDEVDYYIEVKTNSGNNKDLNIYRVGLQPVGLLKTGDLYYFKVNQDDIFPKYMKNKWVVFRLYRVYPSSDSDVENSEYWIPKTGGQVTQYTGLYWCYIVSVFNTEEEILSNSKIRGFRKVIDDNRYFDRIPQVNEVTHWDNGIISNTLVRVDYDIKDDPEEWDKFKLSFDSVIDRTFSVMKMLKPEHELDR